jgi:hypothetical protein
MSVIKNGRNRKYLRLSYQFHLTIYHTSLRYFDHKFVNFKSVDILLTFFHNQSILMFSCIRLSIHSSSPALSSHAILQLLACTSVPSSPMIDFFDIQLAFLKPTYSIDGIPRFIFPQELFMAWRFIKCVKILAHPHSHSRPAFFWLALSPSRSLWLWLPYLKLYEIFQWILIIPKKISPGNCW